MRTALRAGVIILAVLATSAWAATTVNNSKSNNYRGVYQRGTTFVTASTNISAGRAQTVYRTPAAGEFVLTQVCGGTGVTLLQVEGVGLVQVGSGLCQTFSPGMFLAPDQTLTCTALTMEADSFCSITGILGPPPPTPRP